MRLGDQRLAARVASSLALCAIASGLLFTVGGALAPDVAPDRFDAHIRRAAARHLPGWDWRLLKALVRRESSFRPEAVSSAGAIGLAQVTPATARRHGLGWRDLHDPATNLDVAAAYLRYLDDCWKAWGARPAAMRRRLVLASYNLGPDRVHRIWKERRRPSAWPAMAPHLPAGVAAYVEGIAALNTDRAP